MEWVAATGATFDGFGGGGGVAYSSVQNRWVAVGRGTNNILYS